MQVLVVHRPVRSEGRFETGCHGGRRPRQPVSEHEVRRTGSHRRAAVGSRRASAQSRAWPDTAGPGRGRQPRPRAVVARRVRAVGWQRPWPIRTTLQEHRLSRGAPRRRRAAGARWRRRWAVGGGRAPTGSRNRNRNRNRNRLRGGGRRRRQRRRRAAVAAPTHRRRARAAVAASARGRAATGRDRVPDPGPGRAGARTARRPARPWPLAPPPPLEPLEVQPSLGAPQVYPGEVAANRRRAIVLCAWTARHPRPSLRRARSGPPSRRSPASSRSSWPARRSCTGCGGSRRRWRCGGSVPCPSTSTTTRGSTTSPRACAPPSASSMPSLHVVDDDVPNACALGRDAPAVGPRRHDRPAAPGGPDRSSRA